jgi:hypothetical protein
LAECLTPITTLKPALLTVQKLAALKKKPARLIVIKHAALLNVKKKKHAARIKRNVLKKKPVPKNQSALRNESVPQNLSVAKVAKKSAEKAESTE